MQLEKPNPKFIQDTYARYKKNEDRGHELNTKLYDLFLKFNDPKDYSETRIKVAAINKLYSTSILNIDPVVKRIIAVAAKLDPKSIDFIEFTDQIAYVTWPNKSGGKDHERNNISFASKYVHFMSKNTIPIYDSYVWIMMKGYLGQFGYDRMSFTKPKSYRHFYKMYNEFKTAFNLEQVENYMLDKFLWQYGRESIASIEKELNVTRSKARSELQKRIRAYSAKPFVS